MYKRENLYVRRMVKKLGNTLTHVPQDHAVQGLKDKETQRPVEKGKGVIETHPIACPSGRAVGVFSEFIVWTKVNLSSLRIVFNILLYSTMIHRVYSI